jgi:hypothetical protein
VAAPARRKTNFTLFADFFAGSGVNRCFVATAPIARKSFASAARPLSVWRSSGTDIATPSALFGCSEEALLAIHTFVPCGPAELAAAANSSVIA